MNDKKPVINIRALAELSRLAVSDEEIAKLEKEMPSILTFVETIQKADISGAVADTSLRNVMRADENPHETGAYTEVLLGAAPARAEIFKERSDYENPSAVSKKAAEGNYIAVKQVISRK